jgi:hypothetical protein
MPAGPIAPAIAAIPTVREAIAWVATTSVGSPTLEFVLEIADGQLERVELERGGSAGKLVERWRGGSKG